MLLDLLENRLFIHSQNSEEYYSSELKMPIYFSENSIIISKFYNSKNFSTLNLKGNYFLYFLDVLWYAHVVADILCQFEILKKEIPDLQLLPITDNFENFKKNRSQYKFLDDIYDIYNLTDENVISLENDIINIDRFWYIEKSQMSLLHSPFFKSNIQTYYAENETFESVYTASFVLFRDKILPLLKNNNINKNKKIFISRKIANKEIREKHINPILKGQSEIGWFQAHRITDRYYPEDFELIIEDFFKKNGYEIILLEELGLLEQFNLFYNSTHIAMFPGTSMFNLIFSKNNAKIFIVNNIKNYMIYFHPILKRMGIKMTEIPDSKYYNSYNFSKLDPQNFFEIIQNENIIV